MTQTLTPENTIPAMIKAWNEKRLGSLTGETKCMYDYGNGHCCIVGAAVDSSQLPKTTKRGFNKPRKIQELNINMLIELKMINADERLKKQGYHKGDLREIQMIHDNACSDWQDIRAFQNKLLHERLCILAAKYAITDPITPYEALNA